MTLRRPVLSLVLSLLLAAAGPALAADQVVGLQKGVSALSLYAKPYDAQAQSRLPAKDASFPLAVVEADGDFLKVRLGGKEVWIDGAEVAVGKPVDFACVKADKKPTRTASIQGASTGCQ